jgi:hypothetical protein
MRHEATVAGQRALVFCLALGARLHLKNMSIGLSLSKPSRGMTCAVVEGSPLTDQGDRNTAA